MFQFSLLLMSYQYWSLFIQCSLQFSLLPNSYFKCNWVYLINADVNFNFNWSYYWFCSYFSYLLFLIFLQEGLLSKSTFFSKSTQKGFLSFLIQIFKHKFKGFKLLNMSPIRFLWQFNKQFQINETSYLLLPLLEKKSFLTNFIQDQRWGKKI